MLHVPLVPFFLFPHSQLMPPERKYCVFTGACAACASCPIFFYSLIRNLFQSARNILFSQVHVLHVYFVPFFVFPNSQLIPKCTKHCIFTGTCAACASRPIFSIPSFATYSQGKEILYFHRYMCCMCISSNFFLFPTS